MVCSINMLDYKTKTAIIGLGYVGLPLTVECGAAKLRALCRPEGIYMM